MRRLRRIRPGKLLVLHIPSVVKEMIDRGTMPSMIQIGEYNHWSDTIFDACPELEEALITEFHKRSDNEIPENYAYSPDEIMEAAELWYKWIDNLDMEAIK